MRKRTITGFIRSNLSKIDKLQFEGYYLKSIYDEIKKDFPEDFSFKTFTDILYRVRKTNFRTKDNIDVLEKSFTKENNIDDNQNKSKSLKSIMQNNPFDEE